jgi:hypothetical protein
MKAKVIIDGQAFRGVVVDHARRIIPDIINDLKRLIIQSFGGPKSGRFYRRPKIAGGGLYRASARGEAPAIRSGQLFRSLRERFPSPTEGELLIDTPYAAILEGKLGRPYVAPAIQSVRERFKAGTLGRFR